MLNSQKKLKIDESFRLRITRVKYLAGGNKKRKYIHTSIDRKRMSHSLVTIHVGQNLCLPAALFLGKFRLTHQVKHGEADYNMWAHLCSKSRKEQLEGEIIWDMKAHGIQSGRMFGLQEIDHIQQVMYPQYQIVVLSAGHGNAVVSRSPRKSPGMQEIVAYHDKEHFDLITNLEGFLMTGYHCEHCEKAYSNKEQHRCDGTCSRCYRSNDEWQVGVSKQCTDCGRSFRNSVCFQLHKNPDRNGRSLCEKLLVCKKCDQFVNLTRAGKDEKHECGT